MDFSEKESKRAGKAFILDTNILLEDSESYRKFGHENLIIVPQCVIEELESFKTEMSLRGYSSRMALKSLESLTRNYKAIEEARFKDTYNHNLMWRSVGYFDETGAVFLVSYEYDESLRSKKPDQILIQIARSKFIRHGIEYQPILVTRDTSLRLLAKTTGANCEDYRNSHVSKTDVYDAPRTIDITDNATVQERLRGDAWDIPSRNDICLSEVEVVNFGLYDNECVVCQVQSEDEFLEFPARYSDSRLIINRGVFEAPKTVSKIAPLNHEQEMLIEAILDPDISLITVSGRAGCGKTLISVAGALELVMGKSGYKKLVVTRPVVPVGNDIGFLPGNIDEKLEPWMAPVKDAVEVIFSGNNRSTKVQEMKDFNLIEYQAISHVRGRSINHVILLIDEAQNATRHEIKTLISRVGKKAKVIVTGDPWQIDNPQLDLYSNGLAHVISRMKGQPFFVNINMVNSERSPLADAASKLL